MIILPIKFFYLVLSKISTFGFGFGIQPEAEYFQVFSLGLRLNVKKCLWSFTGSNKILKMRT